MMLADAMLKWIIGLLCVVVIVVGLAFALGCHLGRFSGHEIDCPECGGAGVVEYDGSIPILPKGVYVCPMCGGSKKLVLEPAK